MFWGHVSSSSVMLQSRSTWPAGTRPASPPYCVSGFPAPRPAHHWGARSRRLWLSPPGTCQTLAGVGWKRSDLSEAQEQIQRWAGLVRGQTGKWKLGRRTFTGHPFLAVISLLWNNREQLHQQGQRASENFLPKNVCFSWIIVTTNISSFLQTAKCQSETLQHMVYHTTQMKWVIHFHVERIDWMVCSLK